MKRKPFLIGLDVGGTKLAAAALSMDFRPLGRCRVKSQNGDGAGGLFDRACEAIEGAMREGGLDTGDLAGIGVGCPGPLDPENGIVIAPANLAWKNFPLVGNLTEKFNVPAALDNDVNLGVYGEYHFGSARGGRFVLGVFPGTGIGGGLVLDGRIHRGASGAAGEIGHVVLDPDGPLCGCGRRGCLEAYAGRLPLAGRLAAMALRGQAPNLAESAGTDLRDIRSKAIARAIDAGDKAVERAVRAEAARIGLVVSGIVNVVSPDTVVLGGGLVEAMPDLFVEEVAGAVNEYALPFLAGFVKVVPAKLGDDAVVMGAARLIAEKTRRHWVRDICTAVMGEPTAHAKA